MAQQDQPVWREGAMTPIGSILERNIILNGADVLTVKGYTQVPNHILVSDRLSPGAKLTYERPSSWCKPRSVRLSGPGRKPLFVGAESGAESDLPISGTAGFNRKLRQR